MFKEEYKKHYDKIHPTSELKERTRQRVLEAYLKEMDTQVSEVAEQDTEQEKLFQTEEESEKIIVLSNRKRNIIRMTGAIAASFAVIVTGVYLTSSLRQEKAGSVYLPTDIVTDDALEYIVTDTNEKTDKGEKPNKKNEKEEVKNEKEETIKLSDLARYSRAGGVRLDYASWDKVVFHGNFGICVYSLSQNAIVKMIPASEYMQPENWAMEVVLVNSDGTKIYWYNATSTDGAGKVFDVTNGTIEQKEQLLGENQEIFFSGIQELSGSQADVYASGAKNQEMVQLGEGTFCQLMYQAPNSDIQASLGISVINISEKTEKIYSVFGSMGANLISGAGGSYGQYYNEWGTQLFVTEEIEETPGVEETPEVEVIPSETPTLEVPEETVVPETTSPPEEEVPEVTEAPQVQEVTNLEVTVEP